MKPRSYTLPISAAIALLREVQRKGMEVTVYPRALRNTFGELHATATEPLRGVVVDIALEPGEGTLKLKKSHNRYFESAWINVAAHEKIYSAQISALPLSSTHVTFELPSQLEVDDPQHSHGNRFDDTLLISGGVTSYALYKIRESIYRVRADKHIPFDFTARLASQSEGPDYQATVINHPAPGWVDVELVAFAQRLSCPPPASVSPPAHSGVRPLNELLVQATRSAY